MIKCRQSQKASEIWNNCTDDNFFMETFPFIPHRRLQLPAVYTIRGQHGHDNQS